MDVSLDSAWARLLAWLRRHGLWRRQFACIRQHSEEDCGAACVATVAAVHGRFWSLGAIRDAVGTTSNGTTLLGLRRGAEALGFHARAAKANPSILDELDSIPLPLICHWDQNHWVVLHGREHNSLLVADPAVGLVEFDAEAFLLHWQDGVILILEPDPARINSDHPAPSSGLWVLTRYISPFRPLLLQALILNAVIGLMALALPLLMQVLTDDVLVRGDQRMLTSLSLGLMVLFSFRSLLAFMQGHLVGYFAQKLQLQMIMHYGQRLLGLPIRYFETHRSGEVVSRIGDIQHLNGLITQVVMGLPSQLCIALISLALMWTYNSSLTIAALACFVFVLTCNLCFLPAQHRKTQALLVNEAENQGFLVELFRGATVLKTSEATPQAWQEYQRNFGRLTRLSWQALRLELSENTVTTLLSSLTTIALLWYGSVFVIQQQLSIGQLLAFNGMGANVLGFLAGISAVSQEVLKADVVIRRMADVLDREQEKSLYSGHHAVAIDSAAEVLCEDISYHHPGRRPLLEHLHLRLPGGVTTALIGESGCGKSTLSKIIAGLYPLQQGTIHYGQFSMRDLDIDDLRRQVVLIPQDSVVFNRTIFENFTFAHPNVTFAEVVQACRIALADDFIRELPEGYQTMLGEFGANLSGGQRQRLAIARALIGSPAILIMDESTSALDPILEARLMDRLLQHRAGQTTVIVSHRPSVILRADWIVYLEHGHVRDQNHVSALHESAFIAPFLGAA